MGSKNHVPGSSTITKSRIGSRRCQEAVKQDSGSGACLLWIGGVFIGDIETVFVASLPPTYIAFVLAELTIERVVLRLSIEDAVDVACPSQQCFAHSGFGAGRFEISIVVFKAVTGGLLQQTFSTILYYRVLSKTLVRSVNVVQNSQGCLTHFSSN